MKVVLIDPSGFTPPYDHCLANALAQQGCQVALVTSHIPLGLWAQDTIYERWEHFYRLTNSLNKTKIRTYLKGCEHPFNMARLLQRLRRWKPDVIHFQWVPFPLVDRFFLRRLRKVAPLVLTVHDTEPFHGAPSSRLQYVGFMSALKKFDHYIVHTQYSKKALVRGFGLSEEHISVIPHGVFAYYRELISDAEKTWQHLQYEGKKKVLFLGVLKPYKGVDILLRAFARLPEEVAKDAILQIVGYPKMPTEPLKALARELGVEGRVFWDLRFVDEAEVAAYFAQADIVVLPYRRIDQSGVLMIALAFGKPIVASRVGGFAETIQDGVHGFLVEPGNVESLAQALTRLLSDDELRARMASAVERLASEELSWSNIAKQTVRLYQTLVEAKKETRER
jgi:glycosyltransferase involved in cell wall biosynthesis